ncbi:E3 ubiquitin-protein ligase ZNRF2 isoform X3 [Mustela lutreola]|uniref:E3 ubiquitin-protein ligase ZNRF2 isoform X3 n=1 Tax=Mustela lutreola TaxID=9666 RepID=UPI002797667D|nr:E3 ubiquitin-protein ligase ZNRF2 isoform X3 [Mustela lutreola]
MGAKQSGPAAANGRTRAYSGSDLPSSSSGGTNGTAGGGGSSGARAAAAGRFPAQVPGAHQPSGSGGAAAASAAPRSRSLGGAVGSVASAARAAQSSFSIPNSSSGPYGSQDSVHSSPEDGSGGGGGRDRPAGGGPGGPRLVIGSLPAHLSPHMFGGFKCPVCSKFVPSDEMDLHLVMCLTKPRITYNGIISHFSCFCFLLLSLRVQEQKISLQVTCLIIVVLGIVFAEKIIYLFGCLI